MILADSNNMTNTQPRFEAKFTIETLLIVAIGSFSVALRMINLGSTTLSSAEAIQAMAAWRTLNSIPGQQAVHLESALAYAGMLLSFGVLGFTDTAARLLPAIEGCLLTLSPLLLRDRLGKVRTLIMMTLLAISPTAVSASRQVNGVGLTMLAIVMLIWAADQIIQTRKAAYAIVGGVALALVIASDYGSLIPVIALLGGIGFSVFSLEGETSRREYFLEILRRVPFSLGVSAFAVALLAFSSVFFAFPGGIGTAADLVGQFAVGLISRQPNTPHISIVLAGYEPFLLISGVAGVWSLAQSGSGWNRFLAGWGIVSTILCLAYPGALPLHTLWSIVPLAALSSAIVEDIFVAAEDTPRWLMPLTTSLVLALAGMILASLAQQLRSPRVVPLTIGDATAGSATTGLPIDLILIAMWIVLGVIVWLVIASTWGTSSANRTTTAGLVLVGVLGMTGNSGYLAFTNPSSGYILYNRYAGQRSLETMVDTMAQVSSISDSQPNLATVTIEGTPDPAVEWALRDFKNITVVPFVGPEVQSVMVLTPLENANPDMGTRYIGQDFATVAGWGPWRDNVTDFVRWLVYHEAPDTSLERHQIVLWVRDDINDRLAQDGR